MSDTLSNKQRSALMSKVGSSDTKPEWILRCGLHRLGFRYRLENKHLPGRPDLAFPKYHSVVYVHGCYWHRHSGCKDASMPKSNVDFWAKKFSENTERDRKVEQALTERGWRVMVVWECELLNHTVETIGRVARWLRMTNSVADRTVRYESAMDRDEILAVAEQKVRYRLAAYNEKHKLNSSETTEVERP